MSVLPICGVLHRLAETQTQTPTETQTETETEAQTEGQGCRSGHAQPADAKLHKSVKPNVGFTDLWGFASAG